MLLHQSVLILKVFNFKLKVYIKLKLKARLDYIFQLLLTSCNLTFIVNNGFLCVNDDLHNNG